MHILNAKHFPRILTHFFSQTRNHLNDGGLNLPCATLTTARTSDRDGLTRARAPPLLPPPCRARRASRECPPTCIQGSGRAGRHVWPHAINPHADHPPDARGAASGGPGREGGSDTEAMWATRASSGQVRRTQLSQGGVRTPMISAPRGQSRPACQAPGSAAHHPAGTKDTTPEPPVPDNPE